MIPDWYVYARDAVGAIGVLGSLAAGYTRIVYRLGQQDADARKTAKGIEWNNEITELMARRGGSLPPGSDPPPRPRVATLDEDSTLQAIADEVIRNRNERNEP